MVQTDRLPKLEISTQADPIPELIADEEPPAQLPQIDASDERRQPKTRRRKSQRCDDLESDMNVEPEFLDEAPQLSPGAGQFEFYGQIFELHVQQLVKLKGSGGTRRFEVLVRDAHADNEFGVAPERVVQDVHDPSANSDLDRIVVEQLVNLDGGQSRRVGNRSREFLGERGHGHHRGSEIRELRGRRPQEVTRCRPRPSVSKSPRSPASSRCATSTCSSRPAKRLGCHVVLDDFTFHHNSLRWLGSSAVKFLKLDAKITAVAMKERVPQALVVAIAQASKVLGLSCVAKRVDTPAVREWLSAVGLDYAQGFLLDQPKALVSLAAAASK